jgi:hypothetical protein
VRSSLLIVVLALLWPGSARASVQCEIDHAVVDGSNIPYDAPIRIVGPCQQKRWGNLSPAEVDIQAVRINNRGNQDAIIIHLTGINAATPAKVGQWYLVQGRLGEGNAYAEVPEFSMVVEKIDPVPPAPLTPADFVDRSADFEGLRQPEPAAQENPSPGLRLKVVEARKRDDVTYAESGAYIVVAWATALGAELPPALTAMRR